jgi:DENN domain-containing protein 5
MFLTELSSGQTPPGVRKIQKESPVSRSLPRHFKIATNAPTAAGYYDIGKDKLYVAKCITLVCQVAYAHLAELFLTNLYKCLPRHPGPGLSLESYVYNILYEITIPQPGQSIRVYLPPPNPYQPPMPTIIQRPSVETELPLLDFPIRLMFTYLGVDAVIQLYTCCLLENQVLLRSSDYQKLMVVAECVSALLFPFTWQHVYAPILPASLHHFLDAPVPYIMGLSAESEHSAATLCLVDIDKKAVQMPEDLPTFPHKNDFMTELLAILDKYQVPHDKLKTNDPPSTLNPKNLMKEHEMMSSSCTLPSGMHIRRKHSLHDVLDWDRPGSPDVQTPLIAPPSQQNQRIADLMRRSGVDEVDKETMPLNKRPPLSVDEQYADDLRFNNHIREIFLNRFVQMFVAYEQYVIFPTQPKDEWLTNRESLQNFDKASFLSDQPQQYRQFLSRFLESQMFATLIDNKIMNNWEDEEADPYLHIFDGRIKFLKSVDENEVGVEWNDFNF